MLVKNILTATALAQAAVAAPASVIEDRQAACQAVHVFIARGSTEPYPGRQGALADAICAGVSGGAATRTSSTPRPPSSSSRATRRAATSSGTSWEAAGATSRGCTQATTPALSPSSSPGNQIAAALFFGDVRHTPNQAYNVGSAPKSANGIWPRTGSGLSALNAFSSKLQSWCDAGDPACASGNNGQVHTGYFQKYVPDAAAWAKTKL
ncbi:carbohydrate esterase family 5 protein [Apiospora arundinis]